MKTESVVDGHCICGLEGEGTVVGGDSKPGWKKNDDYTDIMMLTLL